MPESLEEPKFEIIKKYNNFEIRKYFDTIQAQVASPLSYEISPSAHFREIAGYIFGNNSESQNISMTAPVHTWEQNNQNIMAFTMPSKFNIDDLPKPNNKRVRILDIEGENVAVLKFSWFAGKKRTKKLANKLQKLVENKEVDKVIEKDGVKILGEANILNKLPVSASNLYAKNVFNFISNLYDKENKKLNINLEDEIIEKTLIK